MVKIQNRMIKQVAETYELIKYSLGGIFVV